MPASTLSGRSVALLRVQLDNCTPSEGQLILTETAQEPKNGGADWPIRSILLERQISLMRRWVAIEKREEFEIALNNQASRNS